MKHPPFINLHIYHIYNRGVEKRKVFLDGQDRFRFIHDLYEFNDEDPVLPANIRLSARRPSQAQCLEVEPLNIRKKRKLLVDILVWCLMPNHFHLLIRQRKDNGIVLFMQKLGTGYTMYFNQKYHRVGPLFQGRFKAVLVENDNYLLHLSRYIHLNPIELIEPNWKVNGISALSKCNRFLEKYRFSSYLDYINKKNFPSITERGLINQYFKDTKEYKKFMVEYILPDEDIQNLFLDYRG
jgi:putative transposase